MMTGWIVSTLTDTLCRRRLEALEIRELEFRASPLNKLAMIFFVVRHATYDARARCTFTIFPSPFPGQLSLMKEGQ